jgi:hypothetical protein
MEPIEAGPAHPAAGPADRLAELSASARGWHTIQMAVLGFIGICGVLRTTDSPAPRAVQWVAAALAVAALAAASLAIFSVGRVAYPVNGAADGASAMPSAGQAAARLRAGIRLTIVAVDPDQPLADGPAGRFHGCGAGAATFAMPRVD